MDKQEKIVSMFDEIAPTYDRANRVMSMGVDRNWRRHACDKALELYDHPMLELIVDVACGTGDMMNWWQQRAQRKGINVSRILGVDPSEGMVGVGREKFPAYEFAISRADELPVSADSADLLSISYGIRNVVERDAALGEFNRILKPGGLVVILEFLKNEQPSLLGRVRDFYMTWVLPKIGGAISRNMEAYEYLPNSIEGFVTVQGMQDELDAAGFEVLHVRSFSMDISTLIIAKKR